jgi:hypothetical protein
MEKDEIKTQMDFVDSLIAQTINDSQPALVFEVTNLEKLTDSDTIKERIQNSKDPNIKFYQKDRRLSDIELLGRLNFPELPWDMENREYVFDFIGCRFNLGNSQRIKNLKYATFVMDIKNIEESDRIMWKYALQKFTDRLKVPMNVSYIPRIAHKWNNSFPLFHVFCTNWKDEPEKLVEYIITIIDPRFKIFDSELACVFDHTEFARKETKILDEDLNIINAIPAEIFGDLNFTLHPNKKKRSRKKKP